LSARIIDGKKISQGIKEHLRKEIELFKKKGNVPSLSAIQLGEDPGTKIYTRAQKKSCGKIGIEYNLHKFGESMTQEELANFIQKLNQDTGVNGIILQMPLPGHLNARQLQHLIGPKKDVEGVSPTNMGMVVYGKPILGPCTAMAVMEVIKSTGIDLYGKEAVMVGRSNIVGKPVALLLVDKRVTIIVCHTATMARGTLPDHAKNADILIAAAGRANLIKGEWIKEGAVVVDVGMNRVKGKIVGDVEFDVAKERASYITPVPGGVGPVTTAMLLRNTIEAAKIQLG